MTPAIRIAEAAEIAIGVHHYEHDPSNQQYGLEAAEALGVPVDSVFKTLIIDLGGSHENHSAIAVIPVSTTLNLKAAAAALGRKNATMTEPEKAERITGYVRGGISPLGTRTTLDTVIDVSASKIGRLYCSGGRRGLDISIGLQDLVQLTNARLASIARQT
ncbi:MAG: Cys-tRNA(Pro) deacylase [Acidimicrobiales bacterium]|jgi:Cys-tRNA(Pro)/Cys-tRNA(Cys) deacylase|nr:Cys-tRNA(Pro) deacylase [Acidimicrobiales bacterium]MDP6902340.1 Cys-tRNA(Pro) deacylase [Acidimicrobiales bacterium]HJL98559.1 Cys-tRNA(Pro) deacylase [Acidimicrobiales bacterium]